MDEQERKAFGTAMTRLFAVYGEPITPTLLSAWWGALAPRYPLVSVVDAMNAHATDPDAGMFRPTPAHIIRHLEGRSAERALGAWARVLSAIRRYGQNYTLVFDDWRIHAAIQNMGGWPSVAGHLAADVAHVERRFCQAYAALTHRQPVVGEYPERLVGLLSPEWCTHFIGDETACRQLIAFARNEPHETKALPP